MTSQVQPPTQLPPWLREPWAALQGARALDRLPHALLLTGPSGIGKGLLFDALANALLCTRPGVGGFACGQCADCRLFAAGTHPDLVRILPDEEGKSGEIKVDAIRGLANTEGLTAHRGGWKLILINPAHRMNTSAANALLKTLEEPASGTLICLLSDQPNRLPATIRSRCQALRISLPAEAEALAWLKPMTQGFDAVTLLYLAHGAPLRARTLAQPELLALRDRLFTGFIAVSLGKRDPLNEAGAWNQADPALIFDWLGGWVSDLLRLRVVATQAAGVGPRRLINADKERELLALALHLDAAAAHRFLQRLWRTGSSDTTNLNRLLLFESWLLEWVASCVPGAASGPLR